ncbi:MAG TPA: methyltransferase domain-containing protein [Acidimicrobiia bacterium]|nr:methyltransferase domain-containing protein [Acidimicrobiia bacterium]
MPLSHRIRRDAVVIALAERDGDRCWYCGCRFDEPEGGGSRTLTLDHVDPVVGGGGSSLDNLRLCCRTCNQRKGSLGADAYDASDLLARRRRQMYREELRKLGVLPPRRGARGRYDPTPMDGERFSTGMTTADWAGERARAWASMADRLEAQIEPVSDLLFAAARLAAGERVIDVGCGRGATTRRASQEVGPAGEVVGLDVAANLIEEAGRLATDHPGIRWMVADAQRAELPPAHFDVVLSRFGVMFFDDPTAAFANLAAATVPGGRLCVAVWQTRDRSEILQRPLDVAAEVAARHGFPLELPPPDYGPCAFGEPATTTGFLSAAGWSDVRFVPHELDLYAGGPGPVADAVELGLTIGSLQVALAEAPPEVTDAIRAALTADLATAHDGVGVKLTAAVAIVTATR